ncbi:hypothetical protein M422DRAFT_181134, partial [Sphaerobolus stellatus SS14]
CDNPSLRCKKCTIELHQSQPCHRPYKWNGEYYQRISLDSIKFIWHLGHGGSACLHMYDDTSPYYIRLVDLSGVHTIKVGWCRCGLKPDFFRQLLVRCIIPASMQRLRTGFTQWVFKTFHLLNLIAHVTPWDWCALLHRLTDNIDPFSISNIYQTFNHVQRQWRLVKGWKRGGVVNSLAPRQVGSLALRCVSCPMPGVNLPADWESHPDRYTSSGIEIHRDLN